MIGFISTILLLFALLTFILFLYSLNKQHNYLSAPFSVMCFAIFVYIIGYALELRSDSLAQISICLKLEYFGAPFMSAFWLLFAYKYHYKKAAPLKIALLIVIIPLVTLFLSVTNEYHHLIYTSISVVEYEGYLLSVLGKGPWYYVNISFAYVVQLIGIVVFFRAWRKEKYQQGTQAFWIFAGSIWPGLVNLIYVLGHSPLDLDLTPFGLSVSITFFSVAVFRKGFFDLHEIVKDVTFWEINQGIIVVDKNNRLIDFNHAAKDLFPNLDKSIIGTDLSLFDESRNIVMQNDELFELKVAIGGSERYYEFRKTVIKKKEEIFGCVYFFQDISKQKQMIQALNHLADYDYLTLVYNRRKLIQEAEKELLHTIRYGNSLSLLMIDIDHFKDVNDQYGHQAGDKVLKVLAAICRNRIRRTDIIGRYGGEEFIIILPETNDENAFLVAEDIRNQIAATWIDFQNSKINVTVSIGLKTTYLSENIRIDQLIHDADLALYHAKHNGRNQTSTDSTVPFD